MSSQEQKEFVAGASGDAADGELDLLWLELDNPRSMADVSKKTEYLWEIRDFCKLPEDCFRNLIYISA